MSDELLEQNRVLRERVHQLEKALASGTDPILAALLEHTSSVIHVINSDGRLLASGRPGEAFGSVVGRSVFEFVEPESVPVMRASFARVLATGESDGYECVGYGPDGTRGHCYVARVLPLRKDGVVAALLVVPTDITERVRLERALVEKEEALRFAVQATHMGLWSWDVVTGTITWDDRMRELWGISETPASYEQYMALVHPDDRAIVEAVIRDALATGVYRTLEHRIAGRGDTPSRWLLAAGSVLSDANGKRLSVMGGALDITEQKQMAAQLQRAERVESIGQLTAGIAHNFNNLLAAIMPNVELSLLTASDAQRPGLTAAFDASLQARDLIRSLMSLTQRGDPRSLAPADPREVVERVVGICRVTFPREIALRFQVTGELAHVGMSVGDLEQVLLNLLFNARDALESTSGTREIAVLVDSVSEAGKRCARIRVTDTGVGMREDVRVRVFEPFFTTKPPHKGSGLGLANVAARVRDSKGSIACESTPAVGTTFTVSLPMLESATRTTVSSAAIPVDAVSGGETILLVDDEPLVRSVVRRLLERERYVVLEASSAAAARDVLQQPGVHVDLVILDQSMPQETGIDALPSLRQLTAAPIVLFTGMAPDLPNGIAAVLEKPARPADMQRVVRAVLSQKA